MTLPRAAQDVSADLMKDLTESVRGRVLTPEQAEFETAHRPWNLAVEQPVIAVVEAVDAADVAALVRFAAAARIGVSVQPNGHGASGSATGTILLRTGLLDRIEIDAPGRSARIGAGVASGALQAATAPHGLTALPGSSPVVSVTGVALGGGLSWFGRAHGWVADSVTAFEIVDADAQTRRVTAETDADLFWALRGGGGDYAIVTGLELTLHTAPEVYGGRVLWAGEHARAVLDAYRALTEDAPDELTAWFDLVQFPGAAPMVAIDCTYLGSDGDARELMRTLDALPEPLSDSRRSMTVDELGSITAEPTDPGAGRSRAELLTRLDDDTITALLAEPIAPLMGVQIRHLGGAFAAESDSPHGALREPYALYMFGLAIDPDTTTAVAARQQSLAQALPVSGRKPVTFLNPSEALTDALPPASIDRLRRIKADRDPGNLFRSNFSAIDADRNRGDEVTA